MEFSGCSSLTKITFPGGLETIANAFESCESLTDVYFGGTEEEWSAVSIMNTYNEALFNAKMHFIPKDVTRLYGKGRYETSFLMADELKEELGVDKFDSVIVACGTNFADALGGSYLAAEKKAPILLTGSTDKRINAVISYVKANLKSNGTVYILGGESAVSPKIDSGLASFNVKRLAGTDRYGTNVEILKEAGVPSGSEIIVATGKDYADSLSASSVGKPLLLVKSKLTKDQTAFLGKLNNVSFTIIGGESAVTEDTEKALTSYGKMNPRLAGKNRFDTSVQVAEKYFDDPDAITLVYSHDFPDGLSAGAYASVKGSPVILTRTTSIGRGAEAYIKGLSYVRESYTIGGPNQISDEAAVTLFDLMDTEYIDTVYRVE